MEKTLEAQAKELLPKIVEKVEILRASKSSPFPNLNSLDSLNGPTTTTVGTNSARGSEFGDLPLPIEIPGLTVPKKEAAGTGGSGSDVASGKSAKSKSKPADGLSSKDGVKVAQKLKPGGPTSAGTVLPKENTKQKEKEDKSGSDSKELSGETDSKEKNYKGTLKVKKSKEEKRKDLQENQKPQASISREKGADAKEVAKKEAGKGAQKDSSRIARGEPDKNQSKETETYSSVEASDKPPSADSKKSLPPRRSARLASLTESKEEEATGSESEEQRSKRDTVSGNKSNTSEDETVADKWQRRGKRPKPAKATTRKRARVLRSSSEDSEQEETSESDDDEEGYESETEEPMEDERPSKKVKTGRFETSRKRKRALPDHESDEDNAGLTRKSKTLKRHPKLQLPVKRRMKLSLSPVPVVTRYDIADPCNNIHNRGT